jgi:hypothetical protein
LLFANKYSISNRKTLCSDFTGNSMPEINCVQENILFIGSYLVTVLLND